MKHFGPQGAPPPIRREPFEFTVLRDEVPETHGFQARITADVTGLAKVFEAMKGDGSDAIPQIMRMIARALDNKDGVPARWRLEPLADPVPDAWDSGETNSSAQARFKGPDGTIYPWEESKRFTAFEAGSSRRRWLALADDDEIAARAEDLVDLFAWVSALAGKDLTQKSG